METIMRSKFTVLSTLAFAALIGAGVAHPPLASDQSAKLGIWQGRWNFSGQIYETKYSTAHPDTGVADCTWTANKGYVICDYFSDNPPHDDLAVISYSPSAKAYRLVQIHKDRPSSSETLTQRGNTWITSSDVPDKGKALVLRTTFVFVTPDKQMTTVQVSADKGQTWTTTIRVTAVKAA
ncbi:MAG: hypothetical protein WAK84_11155 [Candidatus Cybelea sp.]